MKTFLLVMIFGANQTANGPAMIDGFASKAACQVAGEKILSVVGTSFSPNSAVDLQARFECIEISKQ